MRKTLIIANPASNRGGNRNRFAGLSQHCAHKPEVNWVQTTHARHATDLAENAHREQYEAVVAVGGDGTVHEVVNGLMRIPAEQRPRLAVIPTGTGNDFALGAGVFTTDAGLALQRALDSTRTRSIDAAVISDEHGHSEFWDNTLGIGFDASTNLQARRITFLRGFPVYFLAVLRTIVSNFHLARMDLQLEGQAKSTDAIMLALGNGPREGGGFLIAPNAKMDDGMLDVACITRLSRLQLLALVPKFMKGTQLGSPHVHMHSCALLTVSLARGLPIHVDGEIFSTGNSRTLRIQCLPGALTLII